MSNYLQFYGLDTLPDASQLKYTQHPLWLQKEKGQNVSSPTLMPQVSGLLNRMQKLCETKNCFQTGFTQPDVPPVFNRFRMIHMCWVCACSILSAVASLQWRVYET